MIDWAQLKTAEQRLVEARAAKRALVNQLRDSKEAGGFPYLGKTFDSDERSAARIFGAAQAAMAAQLAGQPFLIEWTCADNTVLTLDAEQTIGLPVAMAQHANALHQHARVLKAAIDAAHNQAALDAIDVETGWPI